MKSLWCLCLSEDAGREFVFVLDGSASIKKKDFEGTKDFIHSVMNNGWIACCMVSKICRKQSVFTIRINTVISAGFGWIYVQAGERIKN